MTADAFNVVRCSLAWGGIVPSETVPASQLLPDDERVSFLVVSLTDSDR